MERITSKLRQFLVVTLLCAEAVTTAISQEEPRAIDLNALAARGETLANEDQLAVELRNQQPDDASRRGFDIGMAAAEGQTLPGPGKQKLGASLPANQQRGFNIAVSFSLERNRNAKLGAVGAKIAQADPAVAAARNDKPNDRFGSEELFVFYRLGFDIAMGIFGDPALGAQGNTAWGPGSQKIRDSLSGAGQAGFNAAVKLRLGQEPPPSAPPSSMPTPRPRTPARSPGGATTIDNSATPIDSLGKRSRALDEINGDLKDAGSERSNEIRCRGSRDAFIFTAENSKLDSTGATIIITLLTFEPSSQAAGPRGEGLKPGQCSWVNRPMNERFLIRFETPANAQLKQQLHGSPVDTSPAAAERFPDAQTIPAYLKDSNHYWSFFGAKPVNNFFTATGHKFWKPGLVLGPDDPTGKKNSSRDVFTPKKPE